jgi:hypothetical protein
VPQIIDRPQRTRWPLYVLGFGAASVVAAVIFAGDRLGITPTPTSPTPPTPSTPTSPASQTSSETPKIEQAPSASAPTYPPTKKKVELTVDPADAHVFQDGRDIGTDKVMIEVGQGSTVDLEIRHEGFQTKKIKLDGSRGKTSIHLDPEIKVIPRPRVPVAAPSTSEPPKAPFEKFE